MGNEISRIMTQAGLDLSQPSPSEQCDYLLGEPLRAPAGFTDMTSRLADIGLHLPGRKIFAVREGSLLHRQVRDAINALDDLAHRPAGHYAHPSVHAEYIHSLAQLMRLGLLDHLRTGATVSTDTHFGVALHDELPLWLTKLINTRRFNLECDDHGQPSQFVPVRRPALPPAEPGVSLHQAVGRADRQAVLALLNNKADLEARNAQQDTPLHVAIKIANPKLVQLLVGAGASLEARDGAGNTPLCLAIRAGKPGIADILLSAGAPTAVTGYQGFSPLALAANLGNAELLAKLLAHRADPNFPAPAGLPLHHAILAEKPGMVSMLLKAGADVQLTMDRGPLGDAATQATSASQPTTPIECAVIRGNVKIFNLLRRHGVDVNAPLPGDNTLLNWAAAVGKVDIVNELLAAGVDLQAVDSAGRNALAWAAGRGEVATFKRLLAKGCNPLRVDNLGQNLLHAVASGIRGNNAADKLEITRLLLALPEMKKKIEGRNRNHETPLHLAAVGDDTALLDVLLAAGANLRAKDAQGRSALHRAASWGNTMMVTALLRAGADIDAGDGQGCTPLYLAAARGCARTVKLLLVNGANPWIRNRERALPVHGMALSGDIDTLEAMAEFKLDFNATGPGGAKPWALATISEHHALASRLRELTAESEAGPSHRHAA